MTALPTYQTKQICGMLNIPIQLRSVIPQSLNTLPLTCQVIVVLRRKLYVPDNRAENKRSARDGRNNDLSSIPACIGAHLPSAPLISCPSWAECGLVWVNWPLRGGVKRSAGTNVIVSSTSSISASLLALAS